MIFKKVIIAAFYFPPAQITGSQRPVGLAKYLHHFGWEPIVLTVRRPGKNPPGLRLIETGYMDRLARIKKWAGINPVKGVHQRFGIQVTKNFDYRGPKSRAIKIARELIAYPDTEAGWYGYAVEAASEFIKREKVDAIISTSSPVTAHLVAKKLKQRHGLPWIADMRDLWTQNHYYDKYPAVRFLERRLELKTLSCADALVTVSGPLAAALKELHRGRPVQCITNGFDPEDFVEGVTACPGKDENGKNKKFTITHTGTLYDGKRDPEMLLKVTAGLIEKKMIDRSRMEILFYGPNEGWLSGDVKKYRLQDVVKAPGPVPRDEAIRKQRESQVLLLLLWNDEREKGVYTGKLFEYLGSRRPILAIGLPGSVVKGLLEETGSGCLVSDERQLEAALLRHYREFVGHGEVGYHANEKTGAYSYFALAGEYSKLLDKVAGNGRERQSNGAWKNEGARGAGLIR